MNTFNEEKLESALGNASTWLEILKINKSISIPENSYLFERIHQLLESAMVENSSLNQIPPLQSNIREQLSKLWDANIDPSVFVHTPFHTDFGKHTVVGKHVFINKDVFFTDLGGIQIDDHVLIGPRCSLITVNHSIDPNKRRGLELKPIHIKENAWLGANVTILPGVTVGKNSIVGANSTVTKDIPDNAVVVGTPAKIIKFI
ncbi:sugar O-acetyltransferase [Veillonella rodentium]|uniref:Putative acetyltransferase SACOL2570 n=1 Tax=Veillonella rodentium TaxID=248315 RepID=A0A239ZP93_9FIRM|nr:sugar O-acetyltransferase [Veillonella rodentium]SNV72613.1 Putative acetyltransferase SACOL2570 [Veillonella rodentium]